MRILVAIDTKSKDSTIIEILDTILGMSWPDGTEINIFTALRKDDAAILERLAALAQYIQNELSHCRVFYDIAHGEAKDAIIKEARKWKADLLILGSRGYRGIELLLTGSVSQGVLSQAHCPVLLLKPHLKDLAQQLNRSFHSVIVATDGSIYSRATTRWLSRLGFPSSTRFKLVSVLQETKERLLSIADTEIEIDPEHLRRAAHQEMEEAAQPLLAAFGAANITRHIADGDPRDVIIELADDWQADLIVMGSHGKTGLTKLLLGSVSQSVSIYAPCSVLITREILSDEDLDELKQEEAEARGYKPDDGFDVDFRPHVHPGGM